MWSNCYRIIIFFLLNSTPGRARGTPWSTLHLLWLFLGEIASLASSLQLLQLGPAVRVVVHCCSWSVLPGNTSTGAPPTGLFSPEVLYNTFSNPAKSQPAWPFAINARFLLWGLLKSQCLQNLCLWFCLTCSSFMMSQRALIPHSCSQMFLPPSKTASTLLVLVYFQ